jgi:RNA polymerase sigma-70 factor (ECF subfamily)
MARTDDEEFTRLVAPHHAALLAHCYRMTGSLHDAEDALQDTLLRAWQGLARFEGRSSMRTWLFTIATNACRRLLEGRARRVLPVDFGPPADPHDDLGSAVDASWLEPFPAPAGDDAPAARYESKESVELAFIAALQQLPARQRAVLLLRDVLAFSAQETAEVLESTPASVNSALQRARRTLRDGLPERSQAATLRTLGDAAARTLVARFVAAWERDDVDALVAMLATDVELTMPPFAAWFRGRPEVAGFLQRRPLHPATRWRALPIHPNGQLGAALYLSQSGRLRAHSITVISLRGDQISRITAFLDPGLFPAFGLAATLDT